MRTYYKGIKVNGKKHDLHRYLMEQKLGRKLRPDEVVHHKDGNKLNNVLDNLELQSRSEHSRHHIRNMKMTNEIREKLKIAGQKNRPMAKIKPTDIPEIRKMLRSGILQKDIAKKYDIHLSVINKINKGKAWAWVA